MILPKNSPHLLMKSQEEVQRLREENARLRSLLAQHGIAPDASPSRGPDPTPPPSANSRLSAAGKVALFRRLFCGREDVYAERWESVKGKSGYAPACSNEWKPGVCHKPRIKCSNCGQRRFRPLTNQVIYDHLAGKQTIGIYPLLTDDHCHFLAVDFDKADWREDAQAFIQSCRELAIPAALEISRSGNGAHAWIFFAEAIPASVARQLGAALISYTCNRTRQLSLASYDRLFPNLPIRTPCPRAASAT